MIRTVLCSTLAVVAGSAIVCYADAKDDAAAAADKLASGGNYSWKTSVEMGGDNAGGGGRGRGGFGMTGPGEGKTANGVTAFTTHNNDMDRTTYRKGDKVVMQNQDGEWMTLEEIMAARGGGNGGNGGQGRGNRRGGAGGPALLPAETVKDLVSKTKSLTLADGVYSGDLTDDAAKAAMTGGGRGGRRGGGGGGAGGGGGGPQVSDAKATIKVWVKDGAISKYTSHVTGKTTNRNGDEISVDRTTTTEFSDVGSTKVDVPADAAKKLG